MNNGLSQSLEDYLEIIYNEIKKNSSVKAIDISRQLNVSRATVTEAINKLAQKGYIDYEKYGTVEITKKGIDKAKEIVLRHNELTLFFVNMGIEKKEAEMTACKIEHVISKNIRDKIVVFNQSINNNPELKKIFE